MTCRIIKSRQNIHIRPHLGLQWTWPASSQVHTAKQPSLMVSPLW